MRIAYGDQVAPDMSGMQTDLETLSKNFTTLQNKVNNLALPYITYIQVMKQFFDVTDYNELNNNNRLMQATQFNTLYNNCQSYRTQIQLIIDGKSDTRISLLQSHRSSVGQVLTVKFLICEPIFDTSGISGTKGLKFYSITLDNTSKQYTAFSKQDIQ